MKHPRILIVRTDRMGDVILSTPVIRAIRTAYPNAYLGMMVARSNRELVEGHPDLNALFLYDKKGKEKNWAGTIRFAQALKTHRFDTALILHSTHRVILLSWLAGIRQRIGYARRLPWLLTRKVPYTKGQGQRHELEYNMDLFRMLGVDLKGSDPTGSDPVDLPLFVPTTSVQEAKVEEFLRSQGLDAGKPLIALHPGASCPSKRWPARRFSRLADRLIERRGVQVLVVAGPDGVEQAKAVVQGMQYQAHQAANLFSLGETAALFKKVRCLVSNDSGPVHLAGAVGTSVVSIFGRWGGGLSPRRWGPTGEGSIALHKDVGCRPCLAHNCTIGFICLEAISVEEVFFAVEHVAKLQKNVIGNV
jgi:lipopolysaccharide heptosyltransferase II